MTTTVWFGPPGTGKTTTLVNIVRSAIEAGTPPERIAYLAFTRAAAQEARKRIHDELGLEPEDLPWFRTLHSTAAKQLGIRGGDILEREDWDTLSKALGIDLTEPDDEAGRWLPPGGSWRRQRGRMAQAVHSKRRALGQSLHLHAMAADVGRDVATLTDLYTRALAEYKRQRALLDYGDLIELAPGDLPVDVAVIDEAQDLTPAQWAFATRACRQATDLHIAGDDDQAVYEWAGADVSEFLRQVEQADHVRVLERSYRLPVTVYNTAQHILGRIQTRWPKEWGPARKKDNLGAVRSVNEPEHVDLGEGEWLLTARTRRGLATWERVCREAGVRYMLGENDSVIPTEVRAIRTWETARAGKAVDPELFSYAQDLTLWAARKGHPEMMPTDLTELPIWHEALTAIPPARRRYYEACLRRHRRALDEPARIRITTIHGSKGLEADYVAVIADLPGPAADALSKGGPAADAEHRVWYVAATRARKELLRIQPGWDTGYDFGVYGWGLMK